MKEVALLIPAEQRREILLDNYVSTAVGIYSDKRMHYLASVWQTYIEPSFNFTCNLCYERVLNNYKSLLPALIELEKEANLL